jgi:hypothetical protein
MHGEIQQHIHKLLFNLSNQELAKADKNLQKLVELKVQEKFDQAEKKLFPSKNKGQ